MTERLTLRLASALRSLGLVNALLAAVTLPVVPALAQGADAAERGPDVIQLFSQARALVSSKREFSQAIPLEGISLAPDKMSFASEIKSWRFVFNNQSSPHSVNQSVYVDYERGRFGRVKGEREPWVGDYRMPDLRDMTLSRAIKLLRQAGYTDPFVRVHLRRPLGPVEPPPLYQFTFASNDGASQVFVNTRTGEVTGG